MCTLVFRVHLTFHKLTKGYTVPGNQNTHDKLNQIEDSNMVNPSMFENGLKLSGKIRSSLKETLSKI